MASPVVDPGDETIREDMLDGLDGTDETGLDEPAPTTAPPKKPLSTASVKKLPAGITKPLSSTSSTAKPAVAAPKTSTFNRPPIKPPAGSSIFQKLSSTNTDKTPSPSTSRTTAAKPATPTSSRLGHKTSTSISSVSSKPPVSSPKKPIGSTSTTSKPPISSRTSTIASKVSPAKTTTPTAGRTSIPGSRTAGSVTSRLAKPTSSVGKSSTLPTRPLPKVASAATISKTAPKASPVPDKIDEKEEAQLEDDLVEELEPTVDKTADDRQESSAPATESKQQDKAPPVVQPALIAKDEDPKAADVAELIAKHDAEVTGLVAKHNSYASELIAKHEAALKDLTAKHEAAATELTTKHEAEIQSKERELSSLKSDAVKVDIQHGIATNDLQKSHGELSSRVDSLTREIAMAEESKQHAMDALKAQRLETESTNQREILQLNTLIGELQQSLTSTAKESEHANEELSNMQDVISGLQEEIIQNKLELTKTEEELQASLARHELLETQAHDEMERHEKAMHELREQLYEEAAESGVQARDKAEELEGKFLTATSQMSELREELDVTHKALNHARQANEAHKRSIMDFEESEAKAQSEKSELKSMIQDLEAQVKLTSGKDAEIVELMSTVEKLEARLESSQEDKAENAKLQSTIEQLEAQIKSTQEKHVQEVQSLESQRGVSEKEHGALKEENEKSLTRIHELERQYETRGKRVKALEDDVSKGKTATENSNAKHSALTKELQEARAHVEELQSSHEQHESDISKLKSSAETSTAKNQSLLSELEEHKSRLAQLRSSHGKLEESWTAAVSDLENAKADHTDELMQLKDNHARILKSKEGTISQYRSEADTFEKQIADKDRNAEDLQKSLDVSTERLQEARKELEKTLAHVDTLTSTKEEGDSSFTRLQEEVLELTAMIDEQKDVQAKALAKHEENLRLTQKSLKEEQAAHNATKHEVDESNRALAQAKSDLVVAQASLDHGGRNDNDLESLKADHKAALQSLNADVESLKVTHESDLEKVKSSLKQEYTAQLDALREAIMQDQEVIARVTSEKDELQTREKRLTDEYQKRSKAGAELRDKLAKEVSQLTSYQQDYPALLAEKQRLLESNMALTKKSTEQETLNSRLVKDGSSRQEMLDTLQTMMKELEREKDENTKEHLRIRVEDKAIISESERAQETFRANLIARNQENERLMEALDHERALRREDTARHAEDVNKYRAIVEGHDSASDAAKQEKSSNEKGDSGETGLVEIQTQLKELSAINDGMLEDHSRMMDIINSTPLKSPRGSPMPNPKSPVSVETPSKPRSVQPA